MHGESESASEQPLVLPGIHRIGAAEPLTWLKKGWEDIKATHYRGVFYGAAFAVMGYLITWLYATQWQLTMGLIAGFFLMGPFLCTGIYDLSRQREQGETISLTRSLICWLRNTGSIAMFALLLTFLMIVWARLSVILFALFSSHDFPTLSGILTHVLSFDNLTFVLVWLGVGFVFASLVFAVGVVSAPMMLDQQCYTSNAVFTSVRCVISNPLPLYVWAFLVVVIIGFSLVTGFLPLLITAPLIGHASWHAYRALVVQ